MSSRIADRLSAARRISFVGRAGEQSQFSTALEQEPLPFNILHIYGPGGVGKTSLLKQYIDLCTQAGVKAVMMDARNVEASPGAFRAALAMALGMESHENPLDHLASQGGKMVVLVDTYENLTGLDDWLRSEFLTHLPENTLVVLAGRSAPNPAWRSDPGWQHLVQVLALRNLAPEETRAFLTRRAIPEVQHNSVMAFTHGHPLALSLVAEVFSQRPGFEFLPEDTPDIVKALVEQFIQKVPGPAHRAALEACSLVRVTTEALLAAMLAVPDVHELFEWLRSLSFIESRRGGLFPHDLAREALLTDLRWRNPDWYAELHRRARAYYVERLDQTAGPAQQRMLWDLIFLHRDNPAVRPYFEWQTAATLAADVLRPADLPILVEMVRRHEGDGSARLAATWLERFSGWAVVLRDHQGAPAGFYTWIELTGLTPDEVDLDPAVQAASNYLRKFAPLRSGEVATLFRFWMAADTYQWVSPVQSILFVNIVRYYLTRPALAFTFLPCAAPVFWQPGLA